MIKWDKPCYKCLSHFCDLSCKEPKHLQAPQPKEPEQDQDEVDIRSRLYQRIHELETQLAQQEQEYGVVAGVGKGVEIPAGVKYYYIEPKLPPQRQPLKYEEYSALAETYTIDYGLLDCVDNHLYKPPTALRNKT